MRKLKNIAYISLAVIVLAACSSTPNQTWQPKKHPPVSKKKYNKKR